MMSLRRGGALSGFWRLIVCGRFAERRKLGRELRFDKLRVGFRQSVLGG
jgi:hypothetical protein